MNLERTQAATEDGCCPGGDTQGRWTHNQAYRWLRSTLTGVCAISHLDGLDKEKATCGDERISKDSDLQTDRLRFVWAESLDARTWRISIDLPFSPTVVFYTRSLLGKYNLQRATGQDLRGMESKLHRHERGGIFQAQLLLDIAVVEIGSLSLPIFFGMWGGRLSIARRLFSRHFGDKWTVGQSFEGNAGRRLDESDRSQQHDQA